MNQNYQAKTCIVYRPVQPEVVMIERRYRNPFVSSILLLVFTLSFLTACGGTFEVGIERTAPPDDTRSTSLTTTTPDQSADATVAALATENAPLPISTPTPAPDTTSWNTYSNPSYAISFQYPANWQRTDDRGYVGEDGFFSIGAIGNPGATIDDIAADEAGHVLRPYGSQPIIENLQIQGQEARLILPSADANTGGQAALIIRYPQPVELGDTCQFFVLYADQDHIRTIAHTLQFSVEPAPPGTATPTQPITC
ncbi:MAG: hypothetical protein JSV36_06010 [Anaerolineae bacterium]|nr:MAG: hypothetical protein JSV36_06010 [Anaerolineae bacterium]